jgi:hypothetical protein
MREYKIWASMKQRCLNPNQKGYLNYGGRGVRVCTRWCDSFEAFLADLGRRPSPRHQLDRIDNDGDYEPGNVRWALRAVQNRNRRGNRWIEFNGERRVLKDWADLLGMRPGMLRKRLELGWSVERALATPRLEEIVQCPTEQSATAH